MTIVKPHTRQNKSGKISEVRGHNRKNSLIVHSKKLTPLLNKKSYINIDGRTFSLPIDHNSFIPLAKNGFDLKNFYNKLKTEEVLEASDPLYFNKKPTLSKIYDIEVGRDKAVVRVISGDFLVIDIGGLKKW